MSLLLFTACENTLNMPESVRENVTVERFVLTSNGFDLNAVYTDAGEGSPAVLLIAGSGPCDEDETIGLLKPFADIADGLATQGISSLRVEKRTCRYALSFDAEDGIEEEYLEDCRAAIDWLKEKSDSIYLLGHSLGGQIAPVLASEDKDIKGIILWNSTLRHLADVAKDQLSALDSKNADDYKKYAEAAKIANKSNAKGYYYFGTNDFYWASYNDLDIVGSISSTDIPTLVINSNSDSQLFETDISLWEETFGNAENVTLKLYDKPSHIGYETDFSDQSQYFKAQSFPQELIDDFAEFCQ